MISTGNINTCAVSLQGHNSFKGELLTLTAESYWTERHEGPHPQQVVESGQRFKENISSLVGKLIASSDEEEKCLLQVEVQMTARRRRVTIRFKGTTLSSSSQCFRQSPVIRTLGYLHEMDQKYIHELHPPIEVSSDKLLDADLAGGVQVLKLMHGWEFLHIQTIRGHHVCTNNTTTGELYRTPRSM